MTDKLRYSINEAADMLGIGKSTLWERIAAGKISTVSDGRRTLITRTELERYAGEAVSA